MLFRSLYRRCQRAEAAENDAIGHRGNGPDTNASSQMSTCRSRSRWSDEPPRRQSRHGCFIADVNVSKLLSRGGAMDHRDDGIGVNASSRMSTRRNRSCGGAMGHRNGEVGTNALSRMSTCRSRLKSRWRDGPSRRRSRRERFIADVNTSKPGPDGAMSHRGNGCSTNALSRMSTC